MSALILLMALTLSPYQSAAHAGGVFTVTTDDDVDNGICYAKHCSLREAINSANVAIDTDRIEFAIPGEGIHTIQLTSPLPTISYPINIDGTSQPGYNGTPLIELDGTNAGASANGLTITAGMSIVKGLIINRFMLAGIVLSDGGHNLIRDSYIGTDSSGTQALGNGDGISIVNSPNNTIGARRFDGGNLISGNLHSGIDIEGSGTTNTMINGNLIGTDISGTLPLGNAGDGIKISQAASQNMVGGNVNDFGNLIAYNQGNGIVVDVTGDTGNAFFKNLMFANGGLGIDLGGDGVTPNNPDAIDGGTQNFPVINSVSGSPTSLEVTGTLNGGPNQTIRLEFFASSTCNVSGYGEGEVFLTKTNVTTDANGSANFTVGLDASALPEPFITATATDAHNNTSEFSACVPIS